MKEMAEAKYIGADRQREGRERGRERRRKRREGGRGRRGRGEKCVLLSYYCESKEKEGERK